MTVDFFKQKYGYEIDGMWMPRVTAVTALVSSSNFFAPQASADWGTMVHLAIEQLLKGENKSLDERIIPSMKAFVQWQKEVNLEIENPKEHIEKRVFDKENYYAGTVDLIAKVHGKRGIIDFKTSIAMRDEYSLQTAAYFAAYNKGKPKTEQCETRWILRIDQYAQCMGCYAKKRQKGGKVRVADGNPFCNHQWSVVQGTIELKELQNHEHDIEAFLSAKELWEWYHKDLLGKIVNYPKKVIQKILI